MENQQLMWKLVEWNFDEKQGFHDLKLSPHRVPINYKGQNSYCTVEKSGGDQLIQVIKVNITSYGMNS